MSSSTLIAFSAFVGVLALVANVSEACFASGICGGGYGCAQPIAQCSGGCGGYGSQYACGPYGCARTRARVASSKTLKIAGGDEHLQQNIPQTPDQKFMACCQDRALPDACLSKCTFATYTREALQAMYFRTDKCPMQAAAELQFCAAQGKDHRDCCVRNGVASTLAGQKCLTFCDQRPGNITQLDLSYMSCFDRFDGMKGCFWSDLTHGSGRSTVRSFDNI